MLQALINYFDENFRRATFKKWAHKDTDVCNADKMAEAGFVFNGSARELDSAKCFFCDKSLDGWEASDDPWEEHLSHSPKCEFAKIQKPQDDLTLQEWFDLRTKYGDVLIERFISQREVACKTMFNLMKDTIQGHND